MLSEASILPTVRTWVYRRLLAIISNNENNYEPWIDSCEKKNFGKQQ